MLIKTRVCTKCRIECSITHFAKEHPNRRANILQTICRDCKREHWKEWYRATKMRPAWKVSDGKQCSACGIQKSSDKFRFKSNNGMKSGLSSRCKECLNLEQAEIRRKKVRDGIPRKLYRDGYYLKKFGITVEQYENISAAQEDRCAICSSHSPIGRNLAVDHDHFTGKVRGLLCTTCNAAIGMFKEDANLVLLAYEYLKPVKQFACVDKENVVVSEVVN